MLVEIAVAHRATPRQVALAALARRAFLIPKASTPRHAAESAAAGDALALIDAPSPGAPGPAGLPMIWQARPAPVVRYKVR